MIFQRFTILVVVRIFFMLANMIVIALIFGDKRLFFNQVILCVVLAFQIVELVRFVNQTNRELAKFFYAIRYRDFSISFNHGVLGKSFRELKNSMTGIVETYKEVKIEKEAQFHFLQMLVNQLHIGIIAINDQGAFTLINPTAEKIAGIENVKNWKLLSHVNASFARELESLGDNGKKLIEIKSENDNRFIATETHTLIILDNPIKLITLQDINSAIEQKEIEAWHKLIRILTHEIMNSVTPISSLTETLQAVLQDKNGNPKKSDELNNDTIADIRFSLNTIQKRSEGLLNFVERYRKLTRIPKPKFEIVNLTSFLQSVTRLLSQEFTAKGISASVDSDPGLECELDPTLIEQVLINLITNSVDALEGRLTASIKLSAYRHAYRTIVEVADNGTGISPKQLGEIFVPFFTTKQNGSGIGLSLSKQIMSLHNGSIRVQSVVHAGTSFFLEFPGAQAPR